MDQQNFFIQQTDLYPDIYNELKQIITEEKIHTTVSALPYIPKEYIYQACNPLPSRLEFLAACKKGLAFTLLNYRKTEYFECLKNQKTNFFTQAIYLLKFYKYVKYVSHMGWDLKKIFKKHLERPATVVIGKIVPTAVDLVLPDKEFNAFDKEILNLFETGIFNTLRQFPKTSYFKIQRNKRKMSLSQASRWVFKYYKLYRSIKKKGFVIFDQSLNSFPWLFVSDQIIIRIDGHHRSAIAMHLKLKNIHVLIVTPEDLKAHGKGSNKLFNELKKPRD